MVLKLRVEGGQQRGGEALLDEKPLGKLFPADPDRACVAEAEPGRQ